MSELTKPFAAMSLRSTMIATSAFNDRKTRRKA
jgi:hypothetical protein